MSGPLAGKVWRSALEPRVKPLAAALADLAENDGTRIFPSVAHIAWLLGRTERAVQLGLSKLRSIGVIRAVKYPNGGRGKAVEYVMDEKSLPSRPPWKRPGENVSSFSEKKGEFDDDKGRNLRPERVNPASQKGEVGCTPPVTTRQGTVKDPREKISEVKREIFESIASNRKVLAKYGSLELSMPVEVRMQLAAKRAGKRWKHHSTAGRTGKNIQGPNSSMIEKFQADEKFYGVNRLWMTWLSFLESPESEGYIRYPYRKFIDQWWEPETVKIGEEFAAEGGRETEARLRKLDESNELLDRLQEN